MSPTRSGFSSLGALAASEGAELWDRVVSSITGTARQKEQMSRTESGTLAGSGLKDPQETPSSRFAYLTVEVCETLFSNNYTAL